LYSYDDCGNILTKSQYAYGDLTTPISATEYTYNGKKLVAFGNQSVLYSGHKTVSWRGKALSWWGRKLVACGTNTFAYDGTGKRIAKNDILFGYDTEDNLIDQSNGLHFFYDQTGCFGFRKNNADFFYQKDLQGDVIGIVNSDGYVVAKYAYDAWGNCKVQNPDGTENINSSFIGNVNPFRYRGYYFDAETGLYFLQSRYYDPEVGRFISQDLVDYTRREDFGGLNLYAYCGNNPVMNVDPDGTVVISLLLLLVGAAIGFTVSFVASAWSQASLNGGQINWTIALVDGLFGAVEGALATIPGIGAFAMGAMSAALSFSNTIITTGIETDWQFGAEDFVEAGIMAAIAGIISGIGRAQFLNASEKGLLQKSHRLAKTVSKRLYDGTYYINKTMQAARRSINSARQALKQAVRKVVFPKGYWKDWLVTLSENYFQQLISKLID